MNRIREEEFRIFLPMGNHRFDLFPVSNSEISTIHNLCEDFFGTSDLLPLELRQDWLMKDRNSFRMMKNGNGRIVSFFTVLFLKYRYFSQFIQGKIVERDLSASAILSPIESQSPEENYIYISVVLVGRNENSRVRLCTLLYLALYLDLLRQHRKIDKIYSLAATNDGKKIINHLGFRLCSSAINGSDSEHMYVFDCQSVSLLEKFLSTLPKVFRKY